MPRRVDYEWTVEELDEDGDIVEVHFAETLAGILATRDQLVGPTRVGVLRRVVTTECAGGGWRDDPTTNEHSRDYAYFDENGRLPDECEFGEPLPKWVREQTI